MMVNSAPPKAIDKKFPSMIPAVCFVLFQNSLESENEDFRKLSCARVCS